MIAGAVADTSRDRIARPAADTSRDRPEPPPIPAEDGVSAAGRRGSGVSAGCVRPRRPSGDVRRLDQGSTLGT